MNPLPHNAPLLPPLPPYWAAAAAATILASRAPSEATKAKIAELEAMRAPPVVPDQTPAAGIGPEHFVAYMAMPNAFIFTKTRDIWPAANVNHTLPPVALIDADGAPVFDDKGKQKYIPAATWIAQNRVAHQMTWAPGHPMEIRGKIVSDGGLIEDPAINVFNLYRPPSIVPQAGDASPWLDHVKVVFPDDAEHMINWFAHRVQRPHEKINHALTMIGRPGIGKDTILEPVKVAVGPWNCAEVRPSAIMGRFNGFVKSVMLRISEVHDLGEFDRFSFYEKMKTYQAAPPDVHRVDEKHLREYSVPNVCGVVETSNHKTGGMFLPADDRRHYVAESPLPEGHFPPGYFNTLYAWFENGGNEIVAHYLANLDISAFDPKAPPVKTRAFWDIVDASKAPEDAEMADALDRLGRPSAVTLAGIRTRSTNDPAFYDWLGDKKNARMASHRLDECGYVPVRNPGPKDGMWVIAGKRQTVYAKRELQIREQIAAVMTLTRPFPGAP